MYNCINFQVIIDEGVPFNYGTEGSSGLDLTSQEPDFHLWPSEVKLINTGVKIWIEDPNFAGFIIPRSGKGHKGLVVGNLVGLIDSDYQGYLKVSLWNRNPVGTPPILVTKNEAIAQLVIMPTFRIVPTKVKEFTNVSKRAEGGFGSTGN